MIEFNMNLVKGILTILSQLLNLLIQNIKES